MRLDRLVTRARQVGLRFGRGNCWGTVVRRLSAAFGGQAGRGEVNHQPAACRPCAAKGTTGSRTGRSGARTRHPARCCRCDNRKGRQRREPSRRERLLIPQPKDVAPALSTFWNLQPPPQRASTS